MIVKGKQNKKKKSRRKKKSRHWTRDTENKTEQNPKNVFLRCVLWAKKKPRFILAMTSRSREIDVILIFLEEEEEKKK